MALQGSVHALDPIVRANPPGGVRVLPSISGRKGKLIDRVDTVPFGAAGPGAGTPPASTNQGSIHQAEGWDLFFDRVHVLPRTGIAFGLILATTDEDYEIYNAYRQSSVTVGAIINNATPGVTLPNLSVSQVIQKQNSFLNPTSTFNPPNPVEDIVRASRDGLANFDTTIDFTFVPGGTISLPVSGSRVSMLTNEYEAPLEEILRFNTDVISSSSGKEQRLAVLNWPRQEFRTRFRLADEERQVMQAFLLTNQAATIGLPLWHEAVILSSDVTAGATSFPCDGADDVDFRVSGQFVVFQDDLTFDVLVVDSVSSSNVVSTTGSVNGYSAGTLIVPLREAIISSPVSTSRPPVNLEEFAINFLVTDNNLGAPSGSTSGWSTYNSKILFDDCNLLDGSSMSGEQTQRITYIDNSTGVVKQFSPWDRNKRVHRKGFAMHNRAQILSLRRLLIALRGRQKSFYIPTFINDLTVVASLGIGSATMDIRRIEYARYVVNKERMKTFKITFTDGTSLVREIDSSAAVSSTVERLTLNDTWPAGRTVSEIDNIQFYELVRFDTDEFTIRYRTKGQATMFAPVRTVYDNV